MKFIHKNRKITVLLLLLLLVNSFTACTYEQNKTPKETEVVVSLTSFEGKNGWKTKFNASLFEVWEKENSVRFVYAGEGTGTEEVAITYHSGKQPAEVLYEETQDVDQDLVGRLEGFFNADSGDWCYGRVVQAADDPNGVERYYTAVEHNGGVLLITEKCTPMDTEAYQSEADDGAMEIRENFEWTDHEPQKEFDYVAGTYVREYTEEIEGQEIKATDTIVMNADHSGKISFQDDVDMYWTSYEIVDDSENRYEYKVEGDYLYFDVTGDCMEFERKK